MLKKSELSSFGLSPVFLFCSIFKKGMEQRGSIKREGETEIASFQKSLGIKNVTPGTVNDSVIRYRKMAPSDPRRAVVSFARIVAGATGRNFVFYDSTRQQREKGIENGRYDPETGTTYIDINAGISETAGVLQEQVLPTISHELVHNFATEDPQGFARLSDLVFEGLKESTGKTRTALINAEIRRIKEATPGRLKGKSDNLQRSIASEEIVARACEDRLSNSRVMKEFIAEMDRKDSTLAQKFSNILGEAIAKVKKLFQSIIYKVRSNSPEAKALAKLTDKLDAVQEQFDSLLERRGQTTAEAEQTKNTSERGVMSAERGSEKAKFNQYASFEEQIKYIVAPENINKNIYQNLLIGRTPKVWREIGLSDLPVMMSVSHTRENYFPRSEQYPEGKGMGKNCISCRKKFRILLQFLPLKHTLRILSLH